MKRFLHLNMILMAVCSLIMSSLSYSQESLKLRLANESFKAGHYQQAATYYGEIIQHQTYNSVVVSNYIHCLYKLEAHDKLESFLTQKTADNPKIPEYWVELSRFYFKTSQPEKAGKIVDETCANYPRFRIYQLFINLLAEEFRHKKRVDLIFHARKELNNDSLFAKEAAESHLFLNHYEQATLEFVIDLSLHPAHYQQVEQHIKSFASKDDPKILSEVIAVLKQAKSKVAGNAKKSMVKLLAGLYEENDMERVALAEFKALDQFYGSTGRLLFQFAERQRQKNNLFIAYDAYEMALEQHGNNYYKQKSLYWLAMLGLKMVQDGKSDDVLRGDAIKVANKYINTYPLKNHGKLYLELAKVQAYYAREKESAYVILNRIKSGRFNHQVKQYARFIEADLLFSDAKFNASKTLALELINQLSPRDEWFNQTLWLLGRISFFDYDFQQSLSYLKQISHLSKSSNDAINLKLIILEGLADTLENPSLFEALKKAVEFYKPFPESENNSRLDAVTEWLNAYPQSSLQDNLLLLKAEILESKQPHVAIEIYKDLQKRFPTGFFVDRAIYKQAWLAERHLKDKALALRMYQQLIKDHPRSFYAKEARKRILKLMNPS